MHSKKIINNSLVGIIYRITTLLLGFITRKIFIIYLGEEILGLNSLYINLLDLLNLADLGIGVAVQYQLYEPLVNNDRELLSRILSAAKRIYNTIGVFVLSAGFIISFFIRFLIKETSYPLWFIQLSFMISVTGTALGYFFVHKRLFLQANENMGLINIIDLSVKLITVIISLITTAIFKNFFLYLGINALYNLTANLILAAIFRKRFSDVADNRKDVHKESKELMANLKDVIPMKLTNYVYFSTDNVIISKVLGLTTVALYSNYMTIINSLMSMQFLLGNVLSASIGKAIKENGEAGNRRVYDYYLVYQYTHFIIINFYLVSFVVLIKPFIIWWIGERFLIGGMTFILLTVDFFIHSMYQPACVMYGAAGAFKKDKYITTMSAVINIVISIALVPFMGLNGVIVGTLVTDLYIWIVRSYQIVKDYFRQNIFEYTIKMGLYSAVTMISLGFTLFVSSYIAMDNLILEIIVKAFICVMLPNVISLLLTRMLPESGGMWKYVFSYIKRM